MKLGNSKRACCSLGFAPYNLKLTITMTKLKKVKKSFTQILGDIPAIPSGLFHEGF